MGVVLLAAPRGHCAGVDRAIRIVEEILRRYPPPIYVRRQIVHNTFTVRSLSARGVVFVEELDEVPVGARVVLSAHGVSPAVYEVAARRNLTVFDATCPLVAKVHAEARRYADDGYDILLIGHAEHEEVVGTAGVAPTAVRVIDPARVELDPAGIDPQRVVCLSQTTLAVDDVARAIDRLRERLPSLRQPPSDDVCYASQNRQDAVKAIAPRCQLVLVLGSANSSNSIRLAEVARQSGCPSAYLIDDVGQLDIAWLRDVETVGVTAGASVPEILVSELLARLADWGFAEVEQVITTTETETFALPGPLRRDDRPHPLL